MRIILKKFDPNELDTQVWGTYISWRSPQWKRHATLGHARNSVAQQENRRWRNSDKKDAIVYQYINEKWVEYERYPQQER